MSGASGGNTESFFQISVIESSHPLKILNILEIEEIWLHRVQIEGVAWKNSEFNEKIVNTSERKTHLLFLVSDSFFASPHHFDYVFL